MKIYKWQQDIQWIIKSLRNKPVTSSTNRFPGYNKFCVAEMCRQCQWSNVI